MAELRRTLRLYWVLQRASVRGAMQYRANAYIGMLCGAVWQGAGFAFIWVVMHTFPALGGWTLGEVAFLYGLRLTAHGVAMIPLFNVGSLEQLVREGTFDRYLLRPLDPLVQIMGSRLGLSQAGDLAVGVALLAVAGGTAGVEWTPGLVLFALTAIVGGALIEGAFYLGLSSLSLRLLDTFALRVFVDEMFSKFGSYPMKVFGGVTEWLLTFVLPVAFVAYLPAAVILDKFAHPLAYASPLVGLALFWLAHRLWRGQLKHYQSVGS
ncbi:ABC-2 family transporter protein [Nonomuraea sp. NPDC050310]|uniref:ABC transporter permease n=1 Tax=Nonomuraea sp. NPDC050310 TaxID=3154935 RepID=UPI0033C9F5D5